MGYGAASDQDIKKAIYGGLLLSLSSTLFFLLKGRLTGMSGLLVSIYKSEINNYWRLGMILSIIITSGLLILFSSDYEINLTSYTSNLSWIGFGVAGYLVGLGSFLQNGCTSGHGVCGLPRFSKRSIFAVIIFLISGMLVATLNSNMQIFQNGEQIDLGNYKLSVRTITMIAILLWVIDLIYTSLKFGRLDEVSTLIIASCTAAIFAFGLLLSGMVNRNKVIGFLAITSNWDPTLAFVLGSAVLPNIITFFLIQKNNRPCFDSQLYLPDKTEIDQKLIIGAILFGAGWGISGICPGPGYVGIGLAIPQVMFIFMPALVIGHATNYIIDSLKS